MGIERPLSRTYAARAYSYSALANGANGRGFHALVKPADLIQLSEPPRFPDQADLSIGADAACFAM